MVNQFEKKDGNTLRVSISMDKILNYPSIITGSVSCIEFSDIHKKRFSMCLPDKETAKNVLIAFSQFMKCRMGDNLKNTPSLTVQKIIRASCLGLDVKFELEKFEGDINKANAALSTALNSALRNAATNMKNLNITSLNKPDGKDIDEKDKE